MFMRRYLSGMAAIAAMAIALPLTANAAVSDTIPSEDNSVLSVSDYSSSVTPYASLCNSEGIHKMKSGKGYSPTRGHHGSFNCYLELNQINYNKAVVRLQTALNRAEGFKNLTIDGYYGSGTRSAVLSVQKKYGLVQDGVYGLNTGWQMLWVNSNGIKDRWA